MNPDYDPPDPQLVREIPWRFAEHDDHGEIVAFESTRTGQEVKYARWGGEVLTGLEGGRAFDELVGDVASSGHGPSKSSKARRLVGRFIYALWSQGYVEMDFEQPSEPLDGRYEIERELGRGGIGVVWQCRDQEDDRDVVVKRAWPYFLPAKTADGQIRREANILSSLRHPRIPRFERTFEDRGLLHIVREHVPGERLLDGDRPPDEEIAGIGIDVADVLAYLHKEGFLLLDVTPGNFLYQGSGQVTLIDVGACRAYDGEGVSLDHAVGAPGFSAPEVLEEKRALPASDVDGLGRLIFTLAASRRPTRKETPDDLADALTGSPFQAVVARLCAPDPERRPSLGQARLLLEGSIDG